MNADFMFQSPLVMQAAYQLPPNVQQDNRVGFRVLAHDYEVNSQFYQFLESGMIEMVNGFAEGKTVALNHNYDIMGWAKTIGGEALEDGGYVPFYVLRGRTFPSGYFGSSDEVIDALNDGVLEKVSVKIKILESECSICSSGFDAYGFFRICKGEGGHVPGDSYVIGEGENKSVATCVQLIKSCEAMELSLVYDGANKNARVVNKMNALHESGMIGEAAYAQFQKSPIFTQFQQGGNPEPPQPTGEPPMSAVQAELDLYKEKLSHKDTEVRALTAELALEQDKVATLTKDNQRVDRYKQDAEFARGLILADLREQFTAHKEGVTDAEADDRVAKAKNAPLEDVFEDAQYFRCRADERFGVGEGRNSQADPGKDPRSGKGIVAPRGAVRI